MVRELISRHIWSRLSTVVLITFRSLIYQMKILRLPRGRIFGSVLTADSLSRAQRGFLVVCPSMKQNTVSKLYAAKKRSRALYMKEIIIIKNTLRMVGRQGNTVKTRVQEPSDLRTFRLKFCILIPKYIRTYSA